MTTNTPQNNGRQDLRQSVLDNFPEVKRFTEAKIDLTLDNILISSGAVSGIAACIDAFCEVDDEVILFEPIYPLHLPKIIGKNLTLKTVRMNYNSEISSFEVDYEALRRTLTPKSKVLVLCNPNNPACNVYTKEEYQKISEIIRDYPNLIVVEDSAYFLYYSDDQKPTPFAVVNPQDFHRSVTFYSGGKMYNVTGLRVGIAVGPKDVLARTADIYLTETQLQSAFEQMMIREDMASANEKNEEGIDYYEETRRDVVRRGEFITEELKGCRIKAARDNGTYFILFDVEGMRDYVDEKYYYKMDDSGEKTPELDKAFCRMLYLEKKVGFFPLSQLYFGEKGPDNLVRVSKNRNDADLEYMIKSIKELLEQ